MDLLGKDGPHPYLADVIAHVFAEKRQRDVSAADIMVVQQRTFPGLETISGIADESACLAILREDPHDTLVVFLARRAQGQDSWRMGAYATTAIGRPPIRSTVGRTLTGGGRLIVGTLVFDPRIAAMRVKLADGTVVEETVSNSSVLLFIPMSGPNQWTREAELEVLDANGGVVVADKYWVDPHKRPPWMNPPV